ncbi:uncharacterized protein LOC143248695 [Tachypleus tridentatus]|uniref:uncharacterized protein LOC143248695 n=1 Tax=Tachypleus tridentatus TaxID=6853 RepID=UPI003FD10FCD
MKQLSFLLLLVLPFVMTGTVSSSKRRLKRGVPGIDFINSFIPGGAGGFGFNVPDFAAFGRRLAGGIQETLHGIQGTLQNEARRYPPNTRGSTGNVFYVNGMRCYGKKIR